MLQITDTVAQRLKTALSELDVDQDACFRIGATTEGVKIAVDQERPGDTTVMNEGEVLIVMDTVTSDRLYDRKMEYDKTLQQLVFT